MWCNDLVLEKVRRTPEYRTLIIAYRLLALGVVCGLLAAFAGGVLRQPWPTLFATGGGFVSAAIGLVLGITAFPSVYGDIRYARSGRFILMAMHDVVRGVPKIDGAAR